MKSKKIQAALLLLLFSGGSVIPQTTPATPAEMRLTLKGAQEYAIQHNKSVRAARLDVQASKVAIWETISSGLPQINSSAGFTDNIKQMVFLLPDFIGGTDEKVPITMGSQFNTQLVFQASMPIFNATYYIGIETSKIINRLAETSVKSTELDIREAVTSTYQLILITEESLRILDNNLANLRETLKSTRAMYSVGMAESTDVDQMISNVTMVENSRSSLERTIELNYNMLRFQLGVETGTPIVLKEKLDDITQMINVDALLSQEFNYTQNLNYQLIDGQERISLQNLKTQKSLVLPSLAGVISTTKTGMGDELSSIEQYNSSMFAFQLNIPIIASGERYAKIKKAQINLEKARTTKAMVTDQLLLQEKQLRYNLVNANMQYKSQKDNVDVSKRVYASTENKYNQGTTSSLELTQANQLYLQSENNYVTSLLNLLQTKNALDKLLNNF
jgi:outer membrane protein TolC